ncbi:LADA_0A06656g1_1 [Lachancea dasiensis]|uniref:LADA_0A06656g1_1 n=1 Tax=Lachancea dasiensis TaxID=1072105 RepID=A0A1G4IPQ2_9SACH|nr:LADA_0A06656g1_1 [Lachancea dasiensis]
MEFYHIVAPSPRQAHQRLRSEYQDMKTTRSNSGTDLSRSKKAKFPHSAFQIGNESPVRRPKSATPLHSSKIQQQEAFTELINKRLHHYNLDYVESKEEHLKHIYDPLSRWFCRDVKPAFVVEDCLPYRIESHKEQAKYLCHVLVNLYISVSSLDIQGLISISSKDLADLEVEIDSLALNTDMFKLSSDEDSSFNDIQNFDEDEDDEFDEFVELDGLSFNATGKITARSARVINVNHWANELKNCLHFEIPISLRKILASIFYCLSLLQGQKVYRPMYVDLFEALVSTDDEGTDFTQLLLEAGLEIDYKPMKMFLDEFLPSADAEYTRFEISSKADNQLFRLLLKLAHMAKPFYNHKADILKETMDHFISSLSPLTSFSVFPIITSFVPYHYQENVKITDYFPFLFTLWTTTTPSIGFDTHFYDFVGCIAEDAHHQLLQQEQPRLEKVSQVAFGDFGLLTVDQIDFIFNRVQNHLRNDFQIVSFSRTVRPLIYSINGLHNQEYFAKLQELLKSIETFAHPSNNGPWTKVIAKFVHGFIKMYHQRVKFESNDKAKFRAPLKLNKACHQHLLGIFRNVIFLGAQNKNPDMANYYISCLAYMLDIESDNKYLLLDRVLLDLYDSLGDLYIHSAHRLVSSLKQFTKAARFMIEEPLFRVHIVNLLSLLVAKIDSNDLTLTSNVINCIVSISSFIPLENLISEGEYLSFESHTLPFIQEHIFFIKEGGSSHEFHYDGSAMKAAFKASTTIFENILKVYLDKVVQLVDCDLEEGFISKLNQTTMIMIESMSDSTFKYFADALERTFWENDYFKEQEPNYEFLTIPLGAIVRRDSTLGRRLFDSLALNIRDQIQRGAGSVRSSSEIQHRDVKLLTYLTALSDILRQSRSSMLNYKHEIRELLFFIFDNISNPPLDVHTSLILHNVLTSLCSTEVVDYRLFPNDCTLSGEEKWGGLQFSSVKFSKEMTSFEWHIPTEQEVEFATELLEEFTDYCSRNIDEMMASPVKDSSCSDRMKKYILIITHTLSGSSLLFDAEYNKHKTELFPVDPYKNKLLLLKSIRDKQCDTEELNVDVEHARSDPSNESDVELSAELSEDALDEIHITEQGGEVDEATYMFDDPSSNVPSGIATPEPGLHHGHYGVDSNLSGALMFRDLDIFCCNYFFGPDPRKKLDNKMYLKIQLTRSKIGALFHKLFKFFSAHFEDNTILFKILLHGIKVWFTDIGQETMFNEEPASVLDMDFLENIQNISHVREPYTRTCLAAKAHNLHEARVLLHSTNRVPSRLERVLLRDILKLSMSLYPNIFKAAQGCLVLTMKQLVGSYPIVIKHLIESLEKALKNGEHKKVEVILEVLLIKKIHRKVMSDFKNLEHIARLLICCCRVKDFEVSKIADRILTDISVGLKIPSSVCLLDLTKIEQLGPIDDSITQQVSAVRKAKEGKRKSFIVLLERFQTFLIGLLESDEELGWKIPVTVMKLTSKLQSSLELTPNKDILPRILDLTKTKHPTMIHLAIKNFLNICNKIISLGGCRYDLKNAFDFNFLKSDFELVDTSVDGFRAAFNREMQNFTNPKYYIDSKAYVGYVTWGRPMKVLKSDSFCKFDLRDQEMNCLREFGHLISKEWVADICQILIQDNESRGVFSSCNIEFFELLVSLISNSCTNLEYDDLLELCKSLYDKSDKPSMIMSAEMIAGLFMASKVTTQQDLQKRDVFLMNFLDDCLDHELNQDAVDIWSILCWWLPTSVDVRRCWPFYKKIFDIKDVLDTASDSSADQASKITLLRNTILSLDFRTPNAGEILSYLVVDHPYDQVRQAISKLLSTLLQSQLYPSFPTVRELVQYTTNGTGLGRMIRRVPPEFDQKLKDMFETIEGERLKIFELPAHEILKTRYYYLAATMLNWVLELMKGHNSVVLVLYLEHYLAPFLMNLIKMKDVCNLANLEPTACYIAISFWSLRQEYMPVVMSLIEKMPLETSHELRVQLVFVENFYSKNMLQLSAEQKESILKFVVKHIYNESFVEVRLRAAETLSGIIHTLSDTNKPSELINEFARGLGSHSFASKKKLSKTDYKIHGSVIGLGAVVSAFPYAFPLPTWIPSQLSGLASWARTSGMSGAAAKEIISDFKKVRADTWHLDRAAFTPEELEDLEGVLWRSYYA